LTLKKLMKKTEIIAYVAEHLLDLFDKGSAVVLVGSAARETNDDNSDIDLLIVGESNRNKHPTFSGFHIQYETEVQFLTNLEKGEDFEAWAVRFGIAIRDSASWDNILKSRQADTWPKWQTKMTHSARRLLIGGDLLAMGDLGASQEELLYALGHVSRGLLLKNNVFPLSRPELSQQVADLGYPHLALLHEQFRTSQDVPLSRLWLARSYVKKFLIFLNRQAFHTLSNANRLRSRTNALRAKVRTQGVS